MSFEFDFTRDHLAEIIPGNKQVDEWYAALYEVLPMYEITTEPVSYTHLTLPTILLV